VLSTKRVNKGMKRMNSLPLSPVVVSYATLQGKLLPSGPVTCPAYVLHNTVTLNLYLGFFALCKNLFGLHMLLLSIIYVNQNLFAQREKA